MFYMVSNMLQFRSYMKSIKFLLILIITSLAFSQIFEVTQHIREVPGDLAALRYEHLDNAGNPCALVKLFSNVEGLVFENPMALCGCLRMN